MWEFLDKEIKRQEYMDMRYKAVDQAGYKLDPENEFKESGESEETEMKYMEEHFAIQKNTFLEDLGFESEFVPEEKKEN
jgi:hypothetical protein